MKLIWITASRYQSASLTSTSVTRSWDGISRPGVGTDSVVHVLRPASKILLAGGRPSPYSPRP